MEVDGWWLTTEYIFLLEMKQGHAVYTATLLVMVNVIKGGGRAVHPPPSPSPAWANFTLMMECTPESSRCYSGNSVWLTVFNVYLKAGMDFVVDYF